MKRAFVLFLLVFNYLLGNAQQDPEYTQYMYNMSIINPAYATTDIGVANIGVTYRSQWLNTIGGPKTNAAFLRTPINQRIEAGISFINDKIGDGDLTENNIYMDLAYLIQLGKTTYLSLGIKTGLTFFKTRFNDFELNSGNYTSDPAFAENINDTNFNIGGGLYVFNKKFYVGLSAPTLINNYHITQQNGIKLVGLQSLHTFLTAGYVYAINENIAFKPSFLIKHTEGAPISIDLNANVRIYDNLEFGLSYRFDDAISGLVNIGITPDLRIGYAYDHTTSNLGNFNAGTHEVMLLYNFRFAGAKSYSSPRFF